MSLDRIHGAESDFKYLNVERVKTLEEILFLIKLFKVTFRAHEQDIPERYKYLFHMKEK